MPYHIMYNSGRPWCRCASFRGIIYIQFRWYAIMLRSLAACFCGFDARIYEIVKLRIFCGMWQKGATLAADWFRGGHQWDRRVVELETWTQTVGAGKRWCNCWLTNFVSAVCRWSDARLVLQTWCRECVEWVGGPQFVPPLYGLYARCQGWLCATRIAER